LIKTVLIKNNILHAIITGASKGFGRAIAYELAKRKINLILVALPEEGLENLAYELKKYKIDVCCYETDLSNKENVLLFTKFVTQNYRLNILINNAGIGGTKKMMDANVEYIDSILQLNITASVLLIHQLLPIMMVEDKSYILNVSSMASFSPIGFKTVYPASKRFIQHFSLGLSQELKKTNVFVSVVHPGPMMTNKNVTGRIKRRNLFWGIGQISPEKTAQITINQLFKRKALILPGWLNCLTWLILAIIPTKITTSLLTRAANKELN